MANNSKKIIMTAMASIMLLGSIVGCGQDKPSNNNQTNSDCYSIRLNYNDEKSRDHLIEVEKGKEAEAPDIPLLVGYEFSGWYTSKEGGTKIDFPYTPTDNVTVYAHWEASKVNVNFNLNYEGASNYATSVVDYNGEATLPTGTPEREGYIFRFWTETPDGTIEAQLPVKVKKDVTYYAQWIEAAATVYKVTVKYNNGTEDKTFDKVEGEELSNKEIMGTATATPKKDGYNFVGWALDEAGTNIVKIDGTTNFTPTGDATIYAIYKKVGLKMTFMNNNNDAGTKAQFGQVEFYSDEDVEYPEIGNPTRAGYEFVGWYTLPVGGTKVNFPLTGNNVPKRNATYYAHWKCNPVTTDLFEAEYVYIDASAKFPGYSGNAEGTGIILEQDVPGVHRDNYPLNPVRKEESWYLSYLYVRGAELVFDITATEAMSVELLANMAVEMLPSLTIAPTGDSAYELEVNGSLVNYAPITVTGANENVDPDTGEELGLFKCAFTEYSFGTINLKAGENKIVLRTANDNKSFGGTTQAVAPMIDYIRCSYSGSNKLSWSPIYDNLDNKL